MKVFGFSLVFTEFKVFCAQATTTVHRACKHDQGPRTTGLCTPLSSTAFLVHLRSLIAGPEASNQSILSPHVHAQCHRQRLFRFKPFYIPCKQAHVTIACLHESKCTSGDDEVFKASFPLFLTFAWPIIRSCNPSCGTITC
jgi:hypothetical protein